ncbi:hypothetical protein D3C81_1846060 [compost metagenome]
MATWAIRRMTPLSKMAVTKPPSSILMSDRLPKAVPLVTVDWTIEAVFSWLRPPAEVLRSRVRVWAEMPRPSAHFTL